MMLIDGVIMCVHILQCATNISQQTWTIQYNTIQYSLEWKNAYGAAVTLQSSVEKRRTSF